VSPASLVAAAQIVDKSLMLTLSLFRHAKAAAAAGGQRDFDRPLTDRGQRDAARMGSVLAVRDYDLALVSAARRASETWEIARGAFGTLPEALTEGGLYLSGMRKILQRLAEIPVTVGAVLVVAHNPDLQELALWLAGAGDTPAIRAMRQKFPTSAVATFALDAPAWSDIGPKRAELVQFAIPADLR
jgi:phosphohistidine phosphatase